MRILLSCCLLSLATLGCLAQSGSTPQLTLQGRFAPGPSADGNVSLPQLFSWPASSVFVSFKEASMVSISLTAIPSSYLKPYAVNWFRFFIDGAFAADGFTSYNKLSLDVTLNVNSTGNHTLRIAKMIDGAKGEATLDRIELPAGGSFLPPAPSDGSTETGKRILFIGDSFSVGYSNAAAAIPGTCSPTAGNLPTDWVATCTSVGIQDPNQCVDLWNNLRENSLEAFPAVTAKALGADFQVIGTTGSGLVSYTFAEAAHPNLSPDQYQQLVPSSAALWNRTSYANTTSLYNLSSWKPNIVVVASGTNDWYSDPPDLPLNEWLPLATGLLRKISDTFNQSSIIIQAFTQVETDQVPKSDNCNQTRLYYQAMPSLFTRAIVEKIPNVYYLQLNDFNYGSTLNWCDWHPSARADRGIAEQLSEFIQVVVPDWKVVEKVNLTVNEYAIRPNTSRAKAAFVGPTPSGPASMPSAFSPASSPGGSNIQGSSVAGR